MTGTIVEIVLFVLATAFTPPTHTKTMDANLSS